MKKLIVITCLLLTGCVRPYIQGGISIYDSSLAKPEVCFNADILGHVEAGVEYNGFDLYVRHTSAIDGPREGGGGINEIGVSKRIYFDFEK